MNNAEIRQRIDLNNKIISQTIQPNFFTLNNTVADLLEENRQLQAQCKHEFENGYCIYCDKMEEGENND